MKDNKYIKPRSDDPSRKTVDEEAIYRDAWRIADPGASNPVAIAGTLAQASSALLHEIGTDGVRKHPALRVMAGQLAMLYNVNSIGAEVEDYQHVKDVVDSLDSPGVREILRVRDEQGVEAAQRKTAETIRDMLK